jgi:hypothetical protein
MNSLKNDDLIKDNEESRTGIERRQFSYTAYIPERRSGDDLIKDNEESRTGIERRRFSYTAYIPERRSGKDRRKGFERRNAINGLRRYDRRGKQTHNDL